MSQSEYIVNNQNPSDQTIENPGRPPPRSTVCLDDLADRFRYLSTAIDGIGLEYRKESDRRDEMSLLAEFDALTDRMACVCADLSTVRATRADHLKLKISALLYVLSDEAEVATALARSIWGDLVRQQFDHPLMGGARLKPSLAPTR